LRARDQHERARNDEFHDVIQGWIRGKLILIPLTILLVL
jgi:hypothetical protein